MAGKVVGITCGVTEATETSGAQQRLNRPYVWAVERAGGVPIILPNTNEPSVISRWLGVIDGLLLSGGADLAPPCYGQAPHPKLGDVEPDRDATELPLIREALAQDVPIFAICRGIQSLTAALGGTLYQDLPSEYPNNIGHQQKEKGLARDQFSHAVRIEHGSRLHAVVGVDEMPVNSFHHQAVRDLAPGLVVVSTAPDDVIEGLEAPAHRYVIAVQFHPEETAPHDERSRKLFEAFIEVL